MHMSAIFCHAMVRVKSRESSLGSPTRIPMSKPSSMMSTKRSVKEMSAFNPGHFFRKVSKMGKIYRFPSE